MKLKRTGNFWKKRDVRSSMLPWEFVTGWFEEGFRTTFYEADRVRKGELFLPRPVFPNIIQCDVAIPLCVCVCVCEWLQYDPVLLLFFFNMKGTYPLSSFKGFGSIDFVFTYCNIEFTTSRYKYKIRNIQSVNAIMKPASHSCKCLFFEQFPCHKATMFFTYTHQLHLVPCYLFEHVKKPKTLHKTKDVCVCVYYYGIVLVIPTHHVSPKLFTQWFFRFQFHPFV